MIRYRLLDTFEPGAVQVCVGAEWDGVAPDSSKPVMRWAKLQYLGPFDPLSGDWRDVPVEPT
jgi:hypothetical protein